MAVSTAVDYASVPSVGDVSRYRAAALGGLALTTIASIVILYEITVILGGSSQLLTRVALAIVGGWIVARRLTTREALAIFAALVALGYFWYFFAVGGSIRMIVEAPVYVLVHTLNDAVTIATGRSVLTIGATDVWALSFAPAPIFLIWFLGFGRRYVAAAGVAAATMLLFVFSGDLTWWWSLIGTIGVVVTVGFGAFERRGASFQYVEWLVIVVAIMATTAVLVPLVPGGGLLGPLTFIGDDGELGDDSISIESSLVGVNDELILTGDITLSPEVRFTIEANEPAYWRTGVYDRYTGDGWVRSGEVSTYTGPQSGPESGRTIVQTVTVETMTTRLPAAQRPASITGVGDVLIDEHGALVASDPLEAGESFQVISVQPDEAAIDPNGHVPDEIRHRYTQLPEDVPQRLHDLTAELLADADGPVEKAEIVEAFLQQEKRYSHDVDVPDGDIADAFVFEMDAGYCTYFATAMVTMLRSADVPARLAVGYTHGQEVEENRWVVRGLNSHAWVEVYVPGAGWMPFDPTPAGPRLDMRADEVETAREDGVSNVDTAESSELPFDNDPQADDDDPINETDTDGNETDPINGSDTSGLEDPLVDPDVAHDFGVDIGNYTVDDAEAPPADDGRLFDWEHAGVAAIILVGLVAGAHRIDAAARVRRQAHLRWHLKRHSPLTDCERSLERVEWALGSVYRPRRPGETRRKYHRLFSMTHEDERADRLFEICERARYAGEVDRERADEAIELADAIVGDTVRLGGRLIRRG